MKIFHKVIISSILLSISSVAFAVKDVPTSKVNYVYQLDTDPTTFEFSSSVQHNCGSYIYRVKSSGEAVANRKFSLVLAAFTTKGNLAFHDTQVCEGTRSVVSWIRLIR
ncbi:MAG: hypothetical protein MJK04_08485 [Psychrosphaera sp.]|nr:hypothetical protein [Psychrosphaera sp.]